MEKYNILDENKLENFEKDLKKLKKIEQDNKNEDKIKEESESSIQKDLDIWAKKAIKILKTYGYLKEEITVYKLKKYAHEKI